MMTTDSSTHFDVISVRIGHLTGQLASSAIGLAPEMIDEIITDVLRQVCEVLAADSATLESLSDDGITPGRKANLDPTRCRQRVGACADHRGGGPG